MINKARFENKCNKNCIPQHDFNKNVIKKSIFIFLKFFVNKLMLYKCVWDDKFFSGWLFIIHVIPDYIFSIMMVNNNIIYLLFYLLQGDDPSEHDPLINPVNGQAPTQQFG